MTTDQRSGGSVDFGRSSQTAGGTRWCVLDDLEVEPQAAFPEVDEFMTFQRGKSTISCRRPTGIYTINDPACSAHFGWNWIWYQIAPWDGPNAWIS